MSQIIVTLLGLALATAAFASETKASTHDAEALQADLKYFTDGAARRLAPAVTAADLPAFRTDLLRGVAAALLRSEYDLTNRVADYPAYPSPRELSRTLKLGEGFSRFEGITGIYLETGEHVVLVGPMHGKKVSLLIPEWMRKPPEGVAPDKDPNGWGLRRQTIALKEGVNVITVEKSSNAYVSYYDDEAENAPAITVHFPTGKVNGWFDVTKHTNADWDRLLDNAVGPVLDARGRHIQVAYPVEWFKVFTRGKGVELITNYDTLLHHHYTFMGLVKYNKLPVNRILARVNHNYYMFRDGDGVAYLGNRGTMRMVASPEVVIKGDPCWGFSHESGHVLQMIPQTTWGGMTEVSCNFFSMYTLDKMGNESRLKQQKNYASARKHIIEHEPKRSYLAAPDVFDRLVPFWQLHLHFARQGREDFYADVMEVMRNRPDAGHRNESIRNQFEFIKIACDVAKLDLTDFFEKWGFFWTGELEVNDYGRFRFNITPEMVAETKAYIAAKNYPKPVEDLTLIEE